MRFENKTMIVTGGAGGIGLAIGCRFASEGANVVLVDINLEQLKLASEKLKKFTNRFLLSQCDVSDEEQIKKTVENVMNDFGTFDILVNNAGLMIFKKLEDHTTADWNKILNVDLLGAFYFIKQAFLTMKTGGCIINISSIHALETTPMVTSYAAAKAALISVTRSAAI